MKKIKLFVVAILASLFVACADYSDVYAKAEYYFAQGEYYGFLMSLGELSDADYAAMERLLEEERQYLKSLTSDELEAYNERVDELMRGE